MKNKTEELKTNLLEELDLLISAYSYTILGNEEASSQNIKVFKEKLLKLFNTDQIKKEAVWSFASYLAIKGVDSAKMLNYYDDFIKQYLEKGQNERLV